MKPPTGYPPVLVTGMHRSGVSMAAGLLAACDLDFGPRFPPPSPEHPLGTFEDIHARELSRRILLAATRDGAGGLSDWGIRDDDAFDPNVFPLFADEAATYLRARARTARPWAWQDCRAALLLDFWEPLAPGMRVCAVYRDPREVLASASRLRRSPLDDGAFVLKAWLHYNRRLLDFHERHPDRCLFVSAAAVRARPQGLIDLVSDAMSIDLVAPPDLNREIDPRRPRQVTASEPDARLPADVSETLERLERIAKLPGASAERSEAPLFKHESVHDEGANAPESEADALLLEGWKRAAQRAQRLNLRLMDDQRDLSERAFSAERRLRKAEKRAARAEGTFLNRLKQKVRPKKKNGEPR